MAKDSNPDRKPAEASGHDTQHAPDLQPIAPSRALTGVVIVLLVLVGLAVFGILSRRRHNDVLAKTTQAAAAPTVIALPPRAITRVSGMEARPPS